MLTAIIILVSIAQIVLALFIYTKGRKNLFHILFTGIIISTGAWALSSYASILLINSSSLTYVVRFILFCVVAQNTFFYIFARVFPDSSWHYNKRRLVYYCTFSAAVGVITLTPAVFPRVGVENGVPVTIVGPGMLFFVMHASFSIIAGFILLFKKISKSTSLQKKQLQLLIIASMVNWIIVPITNFILTNALRTTIFIVIGPIYSLIFAALITYTIVAQKLFDIRAAVARSVAYVLLVGSIAFIYSVTLFGIINVIFVGSDRELIRQVLSVLLVFPLALSFQPIKRAVDKFTDKIFYRNSYDTQIVLNKLGGAIVAEIDLHEVLHKTRIILSDALKSSFIEFLFFKKGEPYLESTTSKTLQSHLEEFAKEVKAQKRTVLVTEEVGVHNPLRILLSEDSIAVSLQLKTQKEVVGYVLFGDKKSGDIYSSQDLKLLRIVANELAIAIQNALRFEEIEEFNITLQDKVDEATRKLRQTNEKLKQLDQTKDDFISMASHQLRTPLTSVKGYVSMVIEGDAGKINAQQRKLLDQAFVSSQRMVYLIADLLNVSRLRTGKFIIEPKPTNLADMVEGEISQLIETAKGRGLKLTYDKPKAFPTLMLDETKTRQVIMNFADNAIYYTPSGGHIEVGLHDKGESVEFTVTDDGIGVPKSEQHHLFNKFYRAGNAKKARPDGTGLGLFMAKKVIIAQGGAIIFHTEEGKGSTFGFSFAKKALSPEHFKHVPKAIEATTEEHS